MYYWKICLMSVACKAYFDFDCKAIVKWNRKLCAIIFDLALLATLLYNLTFYKLANLSTRKYKFFHFQKR